MKIGIFGPSGAGKTTLARYISSQYDLPYIHTNGPELRERYGWRSHSDIIRNSAIYPLIGLNYQNDLLDERVRLLENSPKYVSDRTTIDNIAYTLLQLGPYIDEKDLSLYIEKALRTTPFTHLISLPPMFGGPEDDGIRVKNAHYQRLTYWVMLKVFFEILGPHWHGKFLRIESHNFDIKKEQIKSFLQ